MALELGNLSAGIELDLSQFDASMDRAEARFLDLALAAEQASKQKVDVSPTGEQKIDQATKKVDAVTASKKKASDAPLDVSPTGERNLDNATKKVDEVTASKKKASDAPLDVTPTGTEKIHEATRATEELSRAAKEASQSSPAGGGGMFDGLAKSAASALPAVSAIAAVGTTLTKGWDRLESIDTATFKLQGLGHGADSVATIMDSALQSVRGTAFGLGDAVTSAANAVASGVEPGQELTQVLTTMADVSAISGAELTDMGMIFNSVLAKGKLQGDDMLQLLGRGVPVLQMIGDELGVTAAEASKMATDGEISFQIFESAMRNGMGGAAQEMGASMAGSMDNAGAAIGRLGAAVADPVFEAGPGIIGGFTDAVDGLTTTVTMAYGAWEKVPGPVKAVVASLAAVAVAQKVLNTEIGGRFQDKLGGAIDGLKDMGGGFKTAYAQSVALNPELAGLGRGMDVIGTGARNAGSGLMSMFGGPWGLAIAGATAAIGLFISAVQKSKEEQRAAEQATTDWANVLTEADGKITESVGKHALLQVEQAGVSDSMDKLGLSASEVAAGVLDLDGAYDQMIDQLDAVIESGMKAPTAFQGRTYTDAAKAAMELKSEFIELNGQMVDGQAQAEETAKAQGDLADRIENVGDAAEGAGGKGSTFSSILDEMHIDAKTAEDAIENLANSLMGLDADPAVRLQSYLTSSAKAVQDMNKLITEGGKGGFDIETGMFAHWDERGQKLSENFAALTEDINKVTAAEYELAQHQGATGVEASQRAADRAAEYTGKLREQLEMSGWTATEIEKLFDTYNLAPESIMTSLHVEGLEEAQTLFDAVDWSMAKVDGETSSIIVDSSSLNLTKDQAEDLNLELKDLGSDMIEITATDEQARAVIDEIVNRTSDLGTQDNPITFRPDVDAFSRDLGAIEGLTAEFITDPKKMPLLLDDEQARKALDTYNAEYVEIDGMLYVEDNTPAVMNALINLGATSANMPEGNIIINEPTDEILEMLALVGFTTTNLPDGEVLIGHDDIQAAMAQMEELGFLVEGGAEGELVIDSNAVERYKEQQELNTLTRKGAKGDHVITDNVPAVKNNISSLNRLPATKSRHVVEWEADRRAYFASIGQAANVQGPAPVVPGRQAGGTVPNPGYRLPSTGPGTDRRDGILGMSAAGVPTAWVDGGEWVVNRDSSRKHDAVLEAANRDDVGGMFRALLMSLPAHRDGGVVSKKVKQDLAPMAGTPYIFGGWSPAGVDCTGATSLAINSALGLPLFESRHATMNMGAWLSAKGFKSGPGDSDDLVAAFYNGGPGGGHAAMRLPDGTFIESGGNTGGGLTIGGKAGPLAGRGFTDYYHLPYSMDGSEELTGDDGTTAGGMGTTLSGGNFRASYNPIDVKEGASGIGSSIGRSVAVGDIASNTAGGNMSVSGTTVRGMVGNQASTQLTQLAAQHGLEVEANQLLDSYTPNWDVFLKVSPATIEAFNDLGEAEANRVNSRLDVVDAEKAIIQAQKELAETHSESAEKVKEAREKLAEAQAKGAEAKDGNKKGIESAQKALDKVLKDVPEKAQQAAENVELAERALTQERLNEKRAIQDLENAQLAYNRALVEAPYLAVAGWLNTISDGFYALSESLAALNENLEYSQRAMESKLDAEMADIQAQQSLHDAEVAMAREKRRADGQAHDDAMSVRAAEWELSKAREEQARITSRSASESILIAHNVEIAEANLDYQRAIATDNALANQESLELTTIDLEYAQLYAELQAEQLRLETERLAAAQGKAASASALEENSKGWGDTLSGLGGVLVGGAKILGGIAAAPATGGLSLLAALDGVGDVTGGIRKGAGGVDTIINTRDDAWEEFHQLDRGDQIRVGLGYGGVALGGLAGAGVAGLGGSADDVDNAFNAVSGLLSLPLNIKNDSERARLERLEKYTEEGLDDIQIRRKELEIQHAQARLEAQGGAWEGKSHLEDLRELARQELAEQQEQNKQLGDLNRSLGKDTSVLMSIGGAGWGSDADVMAGLETAPLGGFGGLTGDVVDPWATLGMESGWMNMERSRMVMPWDDRSVTPPQGAVDAVSAQQKLADVQDRAMARYLELMSELSNVATSIDTQFTGDVTIQSQKADNLVDDLGRQLARG